jgi:hypothetical protein
MNKTMKPITGRINEQDMINFSPEVHVLAGTLAPVVLTTT